MRHLYGEFTALDGKDYRVDINCANGSGEAEIVLGGEPFVTSMDSSDDIMYMPIKGSGATVSILTESWESEIYTEKPLGTKVTLTDISDVDNPVVKWIGFATPCTYNQPFDEATEYVDVECVDGISVLNNLKFATAKTGKEMTFATIIDNILQLPGCFTNWYISDNIQIQGLTHTDNIVQRLRIFDSNFFDNKDGDNLTDLDRSWLAYDVLYEICQYLGYVAVAVGEDVYFIDYDAIKHGRNSYHKFAVGNPNSSTLVSNISYSHEISGGTISDGGTQIGLDVVYDSVSVKDEFNIVNLKDDSDSKKYNITYADNERMRGWYGTGSNAGKYSTMYQEGFEETNLKGENSTFQCIAQYMWKDKRIATLWQFWSNPKITVYNYKNDSTRSLVTSLRQKCSFGDMMEYNGAYLTRFYKGDVISGLDGYNTGWSTEQKLNHWNRVFGSACKTIPAEDMIVFVNKKNEAGHIGPGHRLRTGKYDRVMPDTPDPEDAMSYPYLEYRDDSSFYFTGDESYLLIKGQVLVHDEDDTPFPMSDGADNSKLKRDVDKKIKCEFYLHARLQIGDHYWNGEQWTTTDSYFRLFWQDECNRTSKDDTRQNQSFYDKWFSFQNLTKMKWEYTEEAYWVPAPPASVIGGQLCLTLYANKDMWGQSNHNQWSEKNKWSDNRYNRYYSSVMCIKNFALDAYVSNGKLDNREAESDTVYCNVIGSRGVNPMDEITFKICTFDNKSSSYSTVAYDDNGTRTMLSHVKNNACNSDILKDTQSSSGDTNLTPEEMYIYRIANQYEKPRIVYDYHLSGVDHKIFGTYSDSIITGVTFVPKQISVDYRQSNTSIKLIEKV